MNWQPKRFWKEAAVSVADGGYTVLLDGRGVKTPAKMPLVVPTEGLAALIAEEWLAQEDTVRPETMPATRAANSALDKVAPQFDAVVDEIAKYGSSDLLCYRAETPPALTERQKAWDALLDWAETDLGARLAVTSGVIPVDQPAPSLANLFAHVARRDAFELAALHDLVAISGSLVLGLAVAEKRLTGAEAFALSRIDEAFQTEQWGSDEEAAEAEEKRLQAFLAAERFLLLCR